MDQQTERPTGLIDLHAHIIPGVDDGAGSEKEALEMLRYAESDGTEILVATPHVFSKLNTVKDLDLILQKQEEFLEKVRMFSFGLTVLPGAEVFFTTNLKEILSRYQHLITLNRSGYFILEFPFDFIFPGIRDFLFNLQMDGWIPLIAHPERNQVIQRNPRLLFDMVQQGALTQVNAGSFLGSFGPEARHSAHQLMQYNLIHAVASDAHSLHHRPPCLSETYIHLESIDSNKADLYLKEIPRAILKDRGLPDMEEPIDPRKKMKFFDFIKRRKS